MSRLLLGGQPIAAPWNARNRLSLTTYDGSGATIHPAVLDMGTAWNGYRYWMADTPYANADNQLENPCVWASNNRTDWVEPDLVSNPLVAAPGQSVGFHSDVELVWDPDASRMVLYYRLGLFTGSETTAIELKALTSTNGTTWTDAGKLADLPLTGGRVSPAVIRTGVNAWRMWLWGGTSGTATMHTATSPLGPWSAATNTTLNGGPLDGWHGDVIQVAGTYYMAYSHNNLDRMLTATSSDGVAWTASPSSPLITANADRWDRSIYRPTLSHGPEAGYVSVWYSAVSAPSPGGHAIGFTRIPLSAWT